jgi:hypothetical protein
MTDATTLPDHGAVSPAPQNVGEGFKTPAYEATAPTAPPGLVPGLKFFLERFGHMMSRFILTVIYALLITPVGVIYRLVTDPLMIRYPSNRSSFVRWKSKNDSVDEARQQG